MVGWEEVLFTLSSTLVAIAYEDDGFAGERLERCVFLVEDSGGGGHGCSYRLIGSL